MGVRQLSLRQSVKYVRKKELQWSLPKRTLREADNPLQRTKPRGTD